MKIVYKDTRTVAFKTIAIGDIFSSYNSLYMRTAEVQSTVTGNPYNAVNLSLGKGACFNDNDEVTLVKAQLVVS